MTEHYFTKKPTTPLREQTFIALLRGNELTFTTGSGVFSLTKIDRGTEVLIKYAIIKKKWDILDLGCGYGPVAVALAKAEPTLTVVATDVNHRAVQLARKNAQQNNVDVDVRTSDMYEKVKEQFDTILLNPPQTAGKKLCKEMITQAKDHLKKGGLLQLVARHQKGGKDLEKHMESVFGNVEAIAKKSGYRVYVSKNL